MQNLNKIFLVLLLCAFTAEEKLPEVQERVAQDLFHEIRCLVCEGESLAESRADFSVDMRKNIREQVAAGKSEAEIKNYLLERYGNQILQTPPIEQKTYLLWFLPFILLGVGAVIILRARKQN